MMEKKPLKRDKALRPLSVDHHHGLLLSWKIRTGLSKQVEPIRIINYVQWFFENHLRPHFDLEENYVFPVLGGEDELVKKALADHQKIESLSRSGDAATLSQLADELEAHIRFEERIVFEKIQSVATQSQLQQIENIHQDHVFVENEDQFWK